MRGPITVPSAKGSPARKAGDRHDEPFRELAVAGGLDEDPGGRDAGLAGRPRTPPAPVSPTACSRSASAKTRRGHLPPSSRATDAPRAPHTLAIWRPVAVEPVNVTLSTRSSATSARPVSAPPVTDVEDSGG